MSGSCMTTLPTVVVTGIGMVTSIGTGRHQLWNAWLAVRCGLGRGKGFDTSRYSVHRGAEIEGFKPEEYVRRLDPRSIGRSSQLAIAAARLALADASLDLASIDLERAGVCAGTTSGEPHFIERFDEVYGQVALSTVVPQFITH